jgi:magnesium-transporting ATPase (P-type)
LSIDVDTTVVGLTSQQAAHRFAADGPNELPTAKRRNLLHEAWDVIRQPMLLLLLGAGMVNFLLAEPLDGALLMAFCGRGHRDLDLPGAQDRKGAGGIAGSVIAPGAGGP